MATPSQLCVLLIQGASWSGPLHRAGDATVASLKPALLYADDIKLLSYEAHSLNFAVIRSELLEYHDRLLAREDADALEELRDLGSYRLDLLSNAGAIEHFLDRERRVYGVDDIDISEIVAAFASGRVELRDPLEDGLGPVPGFSWRVLKDLDEFPHALPAATRDGLEPVIDQLEWWAGRGIATGASESLAHSVRRTEAALSSGFLSKLPSLSFASVDEILGVRDELAPYLSRYRAAMADLSRDLPDIRAAKSWQEELDRLWREHVEPEVQEIAERMSEGRFARQFGLAAIRDARDVLIAGGSTLVGLGTLADPQGSSIGAAAAAAATVAAHAYEARRTLRREARRSRFFMLFQIEDRLRIST